MGKVARALYCLTRAAMGPWAEGSAVKALAPFASQSQKSPDRAGDHPAGSSRVWSVISGEWDDIFPREGKQNMQKLGGGK